MNDPINTTKWDGAPCAWCGDDAVEENEHGEPLCGRCYIEWRFEHDTEPDDQHDAEDER